MSDFKVLVERGGCLEFNRKAISEYILDENMELKAVRFKSGEVQDMEGIHRLHRPKHPLLRTPESLRRALDLFFLHDLAEKRLKTAY
ncbi:MAG: hypothetical protein ABIH11_01460 [Candidatus Altiarchaeota archaeon]